MDDQPLVTIAINNYNYGQFLDAAIDSALSQTYSPIEIVVVDDGSTDNSREIIASYQDQIVPILKENGGQASAFNAGLAASRGQVICLLDADDLFLPQKVAEIVKVFEQQPEVGWCFHPLKLVDTKTGELIRISPGIDSQICDFRQQSQQGNIAGPIPATSGLCFRRSLLEQILPMPEIIRITSDNYVKFLALALSKGYFLNQPLVIQNIHGDNAFSQRPEKQRVKIDVAILTAYCLRKHWSSVARQRANKIFAKGLGEAWKLQDMSAQAQQVKGQYLATVSPLEGLEISLRAFYHRLKPQHIKL